MKTNHSFKHAMLALTVAVTLGLLSPPAGAAGVNWSTFVGGASTEFAYGVAVDASGDVYVVGSTNSNDYPTTPGAPQPGSATPNDVVVTRLRSDGSTLVWSTYLGGSGNDEGKAIAVDASGNVYVTGNTGSGNFPVTSGAWRTTHAGGIADGFVTKISPSGQIVWSTFFGGNWDDYPRTIAVDGSGNVVVAGSTNSLDYPITAGVVKQVRNPSLVDGADGFITKINAAGTALVWSTYFGNDGGTDNIFDLALDGSGQPTVVGWTLSPGFPVTASAYDRTYALRREGFVSRINSTATGFVWSTFIGADGHDECLSVALDASGAAYVTGKTESTNFPVTAGAVRGAYGGGTYDAFAVKLSANGSTLQYSTYLGGSGSDIGLGVAVSSTGVASFTGSTESSNFVLGSSPYDGSANGGTDGFATTLSSSGGLNYSTYLGSSGSEGGQAVALKPNGHVVVLGQTSGSTFPTTSGAYDRSFAGGNDDFITSLDVAAGSVGVGPEDGTGIALAAPWPNPAAGQVSVRFSIPTEGPVALVVRDLQGRTVAVLADADFGLGTHGVTWNGRDRTGQRAPAGVYRIELRTPAGVFSRSLALLP